MLRRVRSVPFIVGYLFVAGAAWAQEPPPVSKTFVGIRGRVTDAKSGEALIEASVKVTRGALAKTALTDVDGYYTLKLPPGEYDLRVFYEMYKARKLLNVVVEKGKATVVDLQLGGDESVVQEVVVEAKADRRSSEALLAERKKSVVVSDSISAQEIARAPDSAASDAVKRIPSATIVDGRYVFIRGLGGRYSSILLNRTDLPSPEPDELSVPLDLFPVSLLSNLNVIKTYSPDLPGNFSGGSLLVETNSYPSKFEIRLKLTFGYNSEATFQKINGSRGGGADWLGFDDGTRRLPRAVPNNLPVQNPPLDDATLERVGESFRNVWSVRRRMGVPPLGLAFSIGGVRNFAANRKFGYLVALNYGYRDAQIVGTIANARLEGGTLAVRENATSITGIQSSQIGALVNLGLQLGTHDLNLFSLYTHNADNEAQSLGGFSETDGQSFEGSRLRFIERELSYTQLRGDHRFARASNLEISWQGNVSIVNRSEPDTRDVTYNIDNTTSPPTRRFRDEPQSGERFFSRLREIAGGGGLHFVIPWTRFKLRWGGVAQANSRRFEARRFRFVSNGSNPTALGLDPEDLFTPANIGPVFEIQERTLQADAYTGILTVSGGYLSGEFNVPSDLRIIAGVRYEAARQSLVPGSPTAITPTPERGVERYDSDFLPSLNLVYALTRRMNLRAAYAYTLARPRFRELAPFAYYDYQRRRPLNGNPLLQTTHIHNADLRWEWFPQGGGVLAASVFYKYFDRPIEQVIVSVADGGVSWSNASAAHLTGAELEARTDFSFASRRLKALYAASNFSFIWSNVLLAPEQIGQVTSRERALQGQSPYTLNLTLGYSSEKSGTEIALLYNVSGPRIMEVGFQGLPDVFEQPVHRFDFTFAQRLPRGVRLKLAAANLAYQSVTLKQEDILLKSFQPGVTLAASLEWAPY